MLGAYIDTWRLIAGHLESIIFIEFPDLSIYRSCAASPTAWRSRTFHIFRYISKYESHHRSIWPKYHATTCLRIKYHYDIPPATWISWEEPMAYFRRFLLDRYRAATAAWRQEDSDEQIIAGEWPYHGIVIIHSEDYTSALKPEYIEQPALPERAEGLHEVSGRHVSWRRHQTLHSETTAGIKIFQSAAHLSNICSLLKQRAAPSVGRSVYGLDAAWLHRSDHLR